MKYTFPAVMFASLLVLAGCDQAEAIDDTHKAAEQALSDATGGLIEKKETPEKQAEESESSSKTI